MQCSLPSLKTNPTAANAIFLGWGISLAGQNCNEYCTSSSHINDAVCEADPPLGITTETSWDQAARAILMSKDGSRNPGETHSRDTFSIAFATSINPAPSQAPTAFAPEIDLNFIAHLVNPLIITKSTCTTKRTGSKRICCCVPPSSISHVSTSIKSMCPLSKADCEKGTAWNGFACASCPPGKASMETGQDACILCAKGMYGEKWREIGGANIHQSCMAECPSGTFSTQLGRSSLAQCKACEVGTFRFHGMQTAETPPDVHAREGCVSCPKGKYTPSPSSTACAKCAAGRYRNVEGGTSIKACTPCEVGKFAFNEARLLACTVCALGRVSRDPAQTVCHACSPGLWANSGTHCQQCAAGKFRALASGASEADCQNCLKGTYSAYPGMSACEECPASRYSDTTGRTSLLDCSACPVGRKGGNRGITKASSCSAYTYSAGAVSNGCPALDSSSLSIGVAVKTLSSSINDPEATQDKKNTIRNFGDTVVLECLDGTTPQIGANVATCGSDGTWGPVDPRAVSNDGRPTQCTSSYCESIVLPGAGLAHVVSSATGLEDGKQIAEMRAKQAPMVFRFECAPSARMLDNDPNVTSAVGGGLIVRDPGVGLTASCAISELIWRRIDTKSVLRLDKIKCQCMMGFKQGSGDKISECVQCLDGTYAPVNVAQQRVECRACPSIGVDCNGGVLHILKDHWYDAKRAAVPTLEGKVGVGSTTKLYQCGMRAACLVNTSSQPQSVRCHENHTGVMCSRCYHRRVECERGQGNDAPGRNAEECAAPGYFDRGQEWMYFAPIARHCVRCPAGTHAIASYIITAILAVTFSSALILLVVHRVMSAWKRLKGKHRSDASGIARVFFNWIQMVSMLQSIKLQPPEEVTNAMETAEVANVSIEWYPVQCSLRFTFFHRVLIYMAMPIFAVCIPLLYVYFMSKMTPIMRRFMAQHRAGKRAGKSLTKVASCFYSLIATLSGDDLVKKASKSKEARKRLRGQNEMEELECEVETLLDDLEAAEAEISRLKKRNRRLSIAVVQVDIEVAEEERHAAEERARSLVRHSTRLLGNLRHDDEVIETLEEHLFFEVISTLPIMLRALPFADSKKLKHYVRPKDVVSTKYVEMHADGVRYVLLSGGWGKGWLRDRLPRATGDDSNVERKRLLRNVEKEAMVDPKAAPIEGFVSDEMIHLFKALVKMSPLSASTSVSLRNAAAAAAAAAVITTHENESPSERSVDVISRASFDHAMPSSMSADEIGKWCHTNSCPLHGPIAFAQYAAIYTALREVWRFESVWEEFQHIDEDGDGVLDTTELKKLVPQGSSDEELAEWMAKFDQDGKGYVHLAEFIAIDVAVQRDMLLLAVGTAFVLVTYFVYSRVTKALLSVFSMENIEGQLYLKFSMGDVALTPDHIAMMLLSSVYALSFTVVVPIVGLWTMFQVRHKREERRVATMAGFLMDGYRHEVAWFWEFIVLARKLLILGVSLFIWEPFMQSFVAVIVLIVALSIQLYVHPFELTALNLLEVGSLTSLLATQLAGVLMWYKQSSGSSGGVDEHYEWYRLIIVIVLFGTNGLVILSFLLVTAWYLLKQKSKALVQWLPCLYPCLGKLIEIEEAMRTVEEPHTTPDEQHALREEWSYIATQRTGRLWNKGAAASIRKKTKRIALKLDSALEKFLVRTGVVYKADLVMVVPEEECAIDLSLAPLGDGNAYTGSNKGGDSGSGTGSGSRVHSVPFESLPSPHTNPMSVRLDRDDQNLSRRIVNEQQQHSLKRHVAAFHTGIDAIWNDGQEEGAAASAAAGRSTAKNVLRRRSQDERLYASSPAVRFCTADLRAPVKQYRGGDGGGRVLSERVSMGSIAEFNAGANSSRRSRISARGAASLPWWTVQDIRLGMSVTHFDRGPGKIVALEADEPRRVHVAFADGDIYRYKQGSWDKFMRHDSSSDLFAQAFAGIGDGDGEKRPVSLARNPIGLEGRREGKRSKATGDLGSFYEGPGVAGDEDVVASTVNPQTEAAATMSL